MHQKRSEMNLADDEQTGPLVSVIIPVYNVAPYLREALDSVIGQTYRKLEILIIDDGSTDESGDICDEYAFDSRAHIIHQENRGLSNARNAGLDRMTGELVCFLDPDDAYESMFVERMVDSMKSGRPDMVVCGYSIYSTIGRMPDAGERRMRKGIRGAPIKEGEYTRNDALRALVDGGLNASVWNKLYRKSLWDNTRFPDGRNYEDMDTLYRVLDICVSIRMIDCTLYKHRERPGSITHTHTRENYDDYLRASAHFYRYVKAHTPQVFSEAQLKRFCLSRLNLMIINFASYAGDREHRQYIRDKIIKMARQIENWRFRSRMAYGMVCYCPWLLKPAISLYRPIRLFLWRIIGR